MTTKSHVLVPIDDSPAAKRAVAHAVALADKLGARLSFAHVQPPSGSIVELKATDDEANAMMAAIAAAYPHIEAPTSIVIGDDIACAICDSFPHAVLVVGSDNAAREFDAQASIAEAVIRNAHDHPVLVVGPRAQTPSFDGPVAVALDGSKLAETALLPAIAWARAFRSPLHLVQAVSFAPGPTAAPSDYLTSLKDIAQSASIAAEAYQVVDDDPVAGIVSHLTAHGCSLVAIASHSHESVARLALGSVTMGLIAESPCTVCAIHPDAPAPAELISGSKPDHAQLMTRPLP